MGVTSLKALNKFVVLLSFTAMQLKKKHDYMENKGIFPLYIIFS